MGNGFEIFISLHIRSMWETICEASASCSGIKIEIEIWTGLGTLSFDYPSLQAPLPEFQGTRMWRLISASPTDSIWFCKVFSFVRCTLHARKYEQVRDAAQGRHHPTFKKQKPHIYVSLQLRVQNRRRKWHFPLNFRNSIIWTSPFPPNIHNAINWAGATCKAFSSSEALISVLSKNARLYDNTVHCTNIQMVTSGYQFMNLKFVHLSKTCQQNTNIW